MKKNKRTSLIKVVFEKIKGASHWLKHVKQNSNKKSI